MYSLYICYFTFGFCLSFGAIAMNFEMMEHLKFSPVEMTMSVGIASAPWCIKPVFGLISDKYIVFDWGKRRPYISMCGILLAYLYMMIPKLIVTKSSMVATMTAISFLMCFTDVCADCITVDYVKTEKVKGKTQGSCWTYRALGSVIGSTFGGSVYQRYGTKVVFQLMTIPCLLMAGMVWNLKLNTTQPPVTVCKKISKAVYKKRALVFGIFAISIAPSYGPFYTYFLRNELHYSPEDFQWISMASSLSFLASTFIYKTFLLKVNPVKLMFRAIIGSVFCQAVQILIASKTTTDMFIVVLDAVGQSFFGMLIIMPVIVAVAKHAKEGIEGTFYALLMSVSNLSGVLSDELGGLVGNIFGVTREYFDNLVYVIIMCATMDAVFQLMVINNKSFVSYLTDKDRTLPPHRRGHTRVTLEMRDRTPDSWETLDHTPETSVNRDHTPDSWETLDRDHTPETPVN